MAKNLLNASSLILLSAKPKPFNSLHNYNVLSLKRSNKTKFMPGGYVFPGGGVDNIDQSVEWLKLLKQLGFSHSSISEICQRAKSLPSIFQNTESNQLPKIISLRITAIRETFEETGILLAKSKASELIDGQFACIHKLQDLAYWRAKVQKDSKEFLTMCQSSTCFPDIWSLKVWSNWLTPPDFPKRFNTSFFTACTVEQPKASPDSKEIDETSWQTPREILSAAVNKTQWLPPPQLYEISRILPFYMLEDFALFAQDRESLGCEEIANIRMKAKDGMLVTFLGDDLNDVVNPNKFEHLTLLELRKMCHCLHRIEIPAPHLHGRIVVSNVNPCFGHILPIQGESFFLPLLSEGKKMELNNAPVTLIVKASTQQIEDQTIQCTFDWTIGRLKSHLSEVYPSRPKPEHQRLIYYGQLLTDGETLRDVLTRHGPAEQVHTVHLVCFSARDSFTPPQPEASAARIQPPNSPMNHIDPQQLGAPIPPDAYNFFMNPAGYQSWMSDSNSYFQHLAWAQQAYANYYMSQYMDMLARQNGDNPAFVAPGAERPVPRRVNAVRQRADDDERNRDWLDNFYIGARVLVLFSIVYFYSSPARFIIVSFLGIIIYLYQVGFFRVQARVLENNNEVLNNNVPADNNNLVQGMAAQEPLLAEERPQTAPPTPQQGAERPSFVALTWTFLSSFFASLIPENQNAV